jgi:hypothetical protein
MEDKSSKFSKYLMGKRFRAVIKCTVTRYNQFEPFDHKLTAEIIITKKPQFQYKLSDLRSTAKVENSIKLWLLLPQLNPILCVC